MDVKGVLEDLQALKTTSDKVSAELSHPDTFVSDLVRAFGAELKGKLAALEVERVRCEDTKARLIRMFGLSGHNAAKATDVSEVCSSLGSFAKEFILALEYKVRVEGTRGSGSERPTRSNRRRLSKRAAGPGHMMMMTGDFDGLLAGTMVLYTGRVLCETLLSW